MPITSNGQAYFTLGHFAASAFGFEMAVKFCWHIYG